MDEDHVALAHPRFHSVTAELFTRRLAPDCMVHACKIVQDEHGKALDHAKLDACCQYGCDVDLLEREAILARTDGIRSLLRPDVANVPWFETDVEEDADYPSGKVVRTRVVDGGCIFLAHDHRGCAIHRASIEQSWDMRGTKPAICRLYPVSYQEDAIVIADEYAEYSCAHVDGPTLYRITRDTLGELFGAPLVEALDAAEAQVLAAVPPAPRKLPVVQTT